YAAAVRSMSMSWKNFFFGSFDPGGFITVDKPPVFLWVDALSVRAFGYSSWSLLLPSAIAGAATVAIVWLILRRYFGTFAATLGALVLALTPITVAVDRLNLPEPSYILALVGAAYAILRSLEGRELDVGRGGRCARWHRLQHENACGLDPGACTSPGAGRWLPRSVEMAPAGSGAVAQASDPRRSH